MELFVIAYGLGFILQLPIYFGLGAVLYRQLRTSLTSVHLFQILFHRSSMWVIMHNNNERFCNWMQWVGLGSSFRKTCCKVFTYVLLCSSIRPILCCIPVFHRLAIPPPLPLKKSGSSIPLLYVFLRGRVNKTVKCVTVNCE